MDYIIDLQNKSKKILERVESFKKLKSLNEIRVENKKTDSIKLNKKKKFFKKKYFKKKT